MQHIKVDMREVMMYKAEKLDSNMDGRMTWHNWFLKSFFVVAECHDIHGGNSTSPSFEWNIFLKSLCDSRNQFCTSFVRL